MDYEQSLRKTELLRKQALVIVQKIAVEKEKLTKIKVELKKMKDAEKSQKGQDGMSDDNMLGI